jgi:hypothetical protein
MNFLVSQREQVRNGQRETLQDSLTDQHSIHAVLLHIGCGKLGTCLLWTACPIIQDAEAEVAVGQERVHPQFVSQGGGLTLEGLGLLDLGRITVRSALAEEA